MVIDRPFQSEFEFEQLEELPADSSKRIFYPGAVESGGQDGVNVRLIPRQGEAWIGTFARGRFGPKTITGIFTMPNPDELCVIAGGQAYILNVKNPRNYETPAIVPVIDVRFSENYRIIILANHTELMAIGASGFVWRTERLSWDSLKLSTITDETLSGVFWDIQSESEQSFSVNLADGTHTGGATLPIQPHI